MAVPLVVSGPSGAGKSTLLRKLFAEFPNRFGFSVSHTTRAIRSGETDGVEYNFISEERFRGLCDENKFIEYAKFGSNWYGTSAEAVQKVASLGLICVLDIDLQGVLSIKRSGVAARCCWVKPPSATDDLEHRLRGRSTESEQDLRMRLDRAKSDSHFVDEHPGLFDCCILNDDLESAYAQFRNFALNL